MRRLVFSAAAALAVGAFAAPAATAAPLDIEPVAPVADSGSSDFLMLPPYMAYLGSAVVMGCKTVPGDTNPNPAPEPPYCAFLRGIYSGSSSISGGNR
ncbi:hypothetical protein JK358_14565 [Nocardia sp. 2]|uniref:Uncharacterized protein n=1 Tax=Nocardia acididurans TaxID=2802282 RepID=A0ABS1M4U9_9NOCA|nr:hypothetical protein [Nocardia acididurans]MBL1075620.1 hypothetical protein [Nocardia acididurans]